MPFKCPDPLSLGEAMEAGLLDRLMVHSSTYRIAVGPQAGRKVSGFSLHAGVAAKAHERQKLVRLCRYISRPAVSERRLSLTPNGNIRYHLKTPYRDGTTHAIFEPLDILARLAALVPMLIEKILAHLQERTAAAETGLLPQGRGPPAGLFG